VKRKSKRKAILPRVTVLGMSSKELLAFTASVESLRHLVDDLRIVAEQLNRAASASRKRKPRIADQEQEKEA
jgi:hypothetical protein